MKKKAMPLMMEQSGHCVGLMYGPAQTDYRLVSDLLKRLAARIDEELEKPTAPALTVVQ